MWAGYYLYNEVIIMKGLLYRASIVLATFKNPYEEYQDSGTVDQRLWLKVVYFVAGLANLILTYGVVIIIVGLSIMTALDIFYMTIPIYQSWLSRKGLDGSRNTKGIYLVSRAAVDSMQEATAMGSSIMMVYLKHRTKTYILSAIIILVLSLGSGFVIDLISAMLKGLRDKFGI